MRNILLFLVVFCTVQVKAQQLNCKIVVNADRISGSNRQVFQTLEKAISEFVNTTRWTQKQVENRERIQCTMMITILERVSGNDYKANLQVQSYRPVYNATYVSPVFNYKDKDFNFRYLEHESLTYNPTGFDSNLVSTLAFYCYLILGMDADTFSLNGGEQYFSKAQEVADIAQQSEYAGWNKNQGDGNRSRYWLIEDLRSPGYALYRKVQYDYHLKGLDIAFDKVKKTKETIAQAVISLQKIYERQPNAFLLQVFFDAKTDELVRIFSGGPQVPVAELKESLYKMAPANIVQWNKIKF